MLTLQKNYNKNALLISTKGHAIDNLLRKQWLLTNGRGGYASSTIAGCNSSSYHGLLIGALNPPVQRIMALSNCLETVESGGKVYNFSTFEFPDIINPAGYLFLRQFRKDTGVHFYYNSDDNNSGEGLKLIKSIYLLRDTDAVAIVYDFINIPASSEFICRPMVGLRDFHSIQKSSSHMRSILMEQGVSICPDNSNGPNCELLLTCPASQFVNDPQWWFDFTYRDNKERGLNHTEDLWTPGFFKCKIDSPTQIVLWASLHLTDPHAENKHLSCRNIKTVIKDLQKHEENILKKNQTSLTSPTCQTLDNFGNYETLCMAADQFIVKREQKSSLSIIAGYPWFADWGRDAFISLPGLLLLTERFDEAKSVLFSFASALDKGMIPAHFDDNSNTAAFNSVDGSLWFVVAAFQFLKVTGDTATFTSFFLGAIEKIIEAYQKGTRYNIHADSDGLITAGNEQTQLTWMDAKYDGITFTPRYGKPVEVNALWYNCLSLLAEFYKGRENDKSRQFKLLASQVKTSFCKLYWNPQKNYLNDCVTTDGKVDDTLRPNQIYSVSLEFSPLTLEQQKSVVKTIKENLLTPYGLRTLNKTSPNYKGIYTGPQRQRDEAYHQGTVWSFLMGPFIESYLKVNQFSEESKNEAAKMLKPLLKHFNEDACIGSVSEIFDGDPPHNPKGCFAQAWSVAELIRAYRLITS